MTVLDATSLLYEWFSRNDCFNLKEDFLKIVTITETPEADKSAVMCGLEKWKDMNMVENHGDYWVLNKKLSSLDHSVTICSDSALIINTFNTRYAEIIEDHAYACDPCNIQEKDVQYLLALCSDLIKSEKSEK